MIKVHTTLVSDKNKNKTQRFVVVIGQNVEKVKDYEYFCNTRCMLPSVFALSHSFIHLLLGSLDSLSTLKVQGCHVFTHPGSFMWASLRSGFNVGR